MNKRISVLSVPIDCVTMDEAVQRILQLTEQPGLHLVATANAEMVMLANENPTLHSILNNASLVVPDGAGILWAAERQGEHVPERVTGVLWNCLKLRRLIKFLYTAWGRHLVLLNERLIMYLLR